MEAHLALAAGTACTYRGRTVRVRQVLDLTRIEVETTTGQLLTLAPHHLQPLTSVPSTQPVRDAYQFATPAAQQVAQDRYVILEPLLHRRIPADLLADTLRQHQLSAATLRRWLRAYRQEGLAGLLGHKSSGGRHGIRLEKRREQVLQHAVQQYLSPRRLSVAYVHEELCLACAHQQLPAPSLNTLRRRIAQIPPKERIRRRQGAQAVQEQCAPVQPNTLRADAPWDVVQVDHALLNLVVLDAQTRQPMGRPWLTLALDVYSRMVVGFHLSLELPGAAGTGRCLAHAILPKETWLTQRDVAGSWPCWGVMRTLHLDNAKEFHGTMLRRACEQYQIQLQFRPPRQPHYGGHIERLIRTLKFRLRHLPGAYLATRPERRTYRPHQHAVFTLPALEKWLATYLVGVYHQRVHSALGSSPQQCYELAVLAPGGRGVPGRLANERQVQLDFLPFVERTIQRYGVVIGHLHYFDSVLSPYITGPAEKPRTTGQRSYIFRTDPQDLSRVYFLDPDTREYHPIPLLDLRQGQFSARTKREAVRRARAHAPAATRLSETQVLAALQELRDQEQLAQQSTWVAPPGRPRRPGRLLRGHPAPTAAAPTTAAPERPDSVGDRAAEGPRPTLTCLSPTRVSHPFPHLDDGTSHLLDS